jgi:hypothetical protein
MPGARLDVRGRRRRSPDSPTIERNNQVFGSVNPTALAVCQCEASDT